MPIYEYECTECKKHIEAFQKITDEPLSVCPECGGELSKLISSTSFVLKGGGWYADGYSSSSDTKGSEPKSESSNTGAPSASETVKSPSSSKNPAEASSKTK